jgi:hypothetical protein
MTMLMAIPMAIKTYSMEVFPESSFANRFTRWSMGFTRVLTSNENCYGSSPLSLGQLGYTGRSPKFQRKAAAHAAGRLHRNALQFDRSKFYCRGALDPGDKRLHHAREFLSESARDRELRNPYRRADARQCWDDGYRGIPFVRPLT